VRDRLPEFGDARLVAVTFASAEELLPHRAHLALPFPMLADPDRETYRQFDLGRGALRDIWSLGTMKMYARLLRQGRKLRRPTQDTRQLGGDFVIDARGRLATGFWPASPDDRPSVDSLIEAVAAAR
jgi:peroxiredoxin